MPDTHTMADITYSYAMIITKGLDCLYESDVRGANLYKTRIEHLIKVIAFMPDTLETNKMISRLQHLKQSLEHFLVNLQEL